MDSTTPRWEFDFILTNSIGFEKTPSLKSVEFNTDEKSMIKGFRINLDNLSNGILTDEKAEAMARNMASLLSQLLVVSSGVVLDFLDNGMCKYGHNGKQPMMHVVIPLRLRITRSDIPFDISNAVFRNLLDNECPYLSTLIEFTNYAIRSYSNNNLIGAILCAYLATGETPTVFEKCNIKGTRNLRNVLAHRINKKEHEGKKEDRTKKAHEKHLSKFERLNSCKFQRNKEGFLDLSSPANLELIGGHASKMIHCLRLLINGRLGLETVNAQIQLG